MADSAEIVPPTMDEILNMKVADLKKKLKEFGLPITGNKNELIERLQSACFSNKDLDSFESSQLSLDESQLESADKDSVIEDSELLLYNSQPYISSSLEDESALLEDSEKKLVPTSSSTIIMSPKKRVLAQAISEGTGVEKKVSINRTNASTLKDFSIIPAEESKPIVVSTDNNVGTSTEKKVSTVKNMSAAERLAMRAKRFNVSDSTVTTSSSKVINIKNSKQSILSSSVAPDLDILKKRAERFGQSVSTVMKQLEHKEKLLKRKCKFGASISAASSLDEQEKKRLRAARFGIS